MKLSSLMAGGLAIAVTASIPVSASGVPQVAHAASGSQKAAELPQFPNTLGRPAAGVADHRLLVKLTPLAADTRQTTTSFSRVSADTTALGGRWYELRGVRDLDAARATLRQTPGVAAVQPDRVRQAFGDQFYKRYQPYLRKSMDVNLAWRRSSGRGVKVAVLDTGVDRYHEDLPRVLRGKDFVSGDRNPQDPVGHGTFVAGVIAAERDNRLGIAGVSRATILPARVLNARGRGRDGDIAKAIRWAVRERADIINLSLGGASSGRVLRDAVRFATRNDVLVVASAGNSGGTRPMYPAAYPDAFAVGATDHRDRMTWWSQHGSWVEVVAPGAEIASTVPGDRYALASGTSFSAPLVAGSAALLLDKHPRWSVEQLRAALLRGAADAGPVGPDPFTALGVPDVDGMLGGPAKAAVAATGPITGTAPGNARTLQQDSVVPASSPEGTDRWFTLDVTGATRVRVTADLRRDRVGSMRGDVELALFDAQYGRLDVANARNGAGTERVAAVVDDDVLVRVRNRHDTRWPDAVRLGFSRDSALPGNVETGGAPRPVLIESSPMPETYQADGNAVIELTTGVEVQAGSVDQQSIRLIDGETAASIPISVSTGPGLITITPGNALAPGRSFALVLDNLRTTNGGSVPLTRVGFRVAS